MEAGEGGSQISILINYVRATARLDAETVAES